MQDREKIDVAVFVAGIEGYGTQRVLINHYTASKNYGIDFHYICLYKGDLYQKLLNLGADVKVIEGNTPKAYPRNFIKLIIIVLSNLKASFELFKKFRAYLKEAQPDLVYTHHYTLHTLAGLAAKSCGIKAIGHFHGLMNKKRNWGLCRIIVSEWLNFCLDMSIAISNTVRESFWGRLKNKTYVLYNGIAVKKIEDSIRKEANRFSDVDLVCVGRLVDWKNQELAIDAVKILVSEGMMVKLVLVGGPVSSANSHYVKLKNQVVRLGLEENVFFAGFEKEPAVIVSKAKASVLCSSNEPFGLVVLEAMVCKTVVVVAEAAGPGEIIKHGETGLKFQPGDAKSLAQCLHEVLTNKELREQLVEKAYANVVENFTVESHIQQLREKFCSVLNQS